jgi:predicted RNA polymerase sigma factor
MLIHQESIINADPQAVYEVLTDGQKFAAATGMPAQLSDREGETFTLFGGRVEGRQIELVPGQRIVQAWRFGATHLQQPRDWHQIAALYGTLAKRTGSPVVALNRAAAIAELDGPDAGLALLEGLTLDDYRYYHSTRADLLRRAGRTGDARAAYARALELAETDPERQFLARRLEELA